MIWLLSLPLPFLFFLLNVFKSANMMILMAYGSSIVTIIKLCYPLVNWNSIPASPCFGERSLSGFATYSWLVGWLVDIIYPDPSQ
jgi:hypothetical protein